MRYYGTVNDGEQKIRLQQRRETDREWGSPQQRQTTHYSARGLTGGDEQHLSLQNEREGCSKGERPTGDGQQQAQARPHML